MRKQAGLVSANNLALNAVPNCRAKKQIYRRKLRIQFLAAQNLLGMADPHEASREDVLLMIIKTLHRNLQVLCLRASRGVACELEFNRVSEGDLWIQIQRQIQIEIEIQMQLQIKARIQ